MVIENTTWFVPRIRNVWPSRPWLTTVNGESLPLVDPQLLRADRVVVERDRDVGRVRLRWRACAPAAGEREQGERG